VRLVLLRASRQPSGRKSIGASLVREDEILAQRRDRVPDRAAIKRDQLVSDAKRELRCRQERSVDGIDEHLAVVDIERQWQRHREVARKRNERVSVVQRRHVVDQRLLKIEIGLLVDLLHPGVEPQQIEPKHVPLPLVRRVVLRVETRQLIQVGDPLLLGQFGLTISRCCTKRCYEHRRPDCPHRILSSSAAGPRPAAATLTPAALAATEFGVRSE
jgi:hypothetical protein